MNQNNLENFLKGKELDIQSANVALFVVDLAFSSFADAHLKHGENFAPVFCYVTYKNLSPAFQITPLENIKRTHEKFYADYLKNPGSFKKFIAQEKNLLKQADAIWKAFKKSKQELKDLTEAYNKLLAIAREWFMAAVVSEDKGALIEEIIIPRFAQNHNMPLAKAHEVLDVLFMPEQQSEFNLERIAFLKLCLYALKNGALHHSEEHRDEESRYPCAHNYSSRVRFKSYKISGKQNYQFRRALDTYIKNFFWTKIDYYNVKDVTPEDIINEIKNEIKAKSGKEIKAELDKLLRVPENFSRQKKEILAKIKLTSQDKKDILFAQAMFYWMDQRKMMMMKLFFYLLSILQDAAKKFDLTYQEISYYRAEEIKELLTKGRKLERKTLENRKRGVFMVFDKGQKFHAVYGKEGKNLFTIATTKKQHDILKGKVASTGNIKNVIGKVHIIHDPSKEKFKEGEILVTSMTRVEFVPLMRRALAIITNEGGIASHAAIISRELEKPCIIGTHHATKMLKTGDKVEMDMLSGEIKVLT